MLDKIFRRSDAIDREALCIIAGERVSIHPRITFLHPFPSRLNPNLPFEYRSGTSASQSTPSQTPARSSTAQA